MELSFAKLEGKSRKYYIALGVLGALVICGLVCFAFSYIRGHQLFGSSNAIPWGLPIVATIYLIGLSAGSLILSALTYLLGREEYKPISRVAVFLAVMLIMGAMIAIGIDLGRPEKFVRLFTFQNITSMFTLNAIFYSTYFAIGIVYLGSMFAGKLKVTKTIGSIAVGWAMLVHGGTGAIFGFIAAREYWNSPIKPLEFIVAALTSGVALLIVVLVLTLKLSGREINKKLLGDLGRILSFFIVGLFALILVDKLTHAYPPGGELRYLLFGPYSWIFWFLQIGLSVVIPSAILWHPKAGKAVPGLVAAGVMVVIGIFFERYYLVIPSAAAPMEYFPGEIQGIYGSVASFPITIVELGVMIGVFALVALLYMLGLRFLELLPVKQGKNGKNKE